MKNAGNRIRLAVVLFMTGGLMCLASSDSYEPDNSYSTAKTITTDGQLQSHSISPAADEDWMTFTLSSLAEVVIQTSGTTGDTVLWLYDSQLNQLDYNDDTGTGTFSKIQKTLAAGTYFIRVREYNDKAQIAEYFVSVLATSIKVLSVTPATAIQGDTLPVTIQGQGTTFYQTSSTVTRVWLSKGDLTLDAKTFAGKDAYTLEATFELPMTAATGAWSVHVTDSVDGEIAPFVNGITIRLYPDINGDGKVDTADLALLSEQWLKIAVPYVVGMTVDEAKAAITAASLAVGSTSKGYHDTIPIGYVMATNPAVGAKVSSGSTVNLIVSRGPAGVIPTMTWVTIDDAGVSGHEGFSGQMSKFETTNKQFCQFLNAALYTGDITVSGSEILGASGSNSGTDFAGQVYYTLNGPGSTTGTATNGGASRITYTGGDFIVAAGFDEHPVTYVSWYGATAFCNYYGFRLPTEWEWQAAADYDGTYTYGCGTAISAAKANYSATTHTEGTIAVGYFDAYGYGLCDMAGNVWEWTSSLYDTEHDYRVLRGGSWISADTGCSVLLRPYSTYPYGTSYLGGFRVCK